MAIRTGHRGRLAEDPPDAEPGEWWYNTTDKSFKFKTHDGTITLKVDEDPILNGTYEKIESIGNKALGGKKTKPPTVEIVDNASLFVFTLNKANTFYILPVPTDHAEGPIAFAPIWTNDGGVDDAGKYAKWQITYRCAGAGERVSGTDGTLAVETAYPSATARVKVYSDYMEIPEASFAGKTCILIKLMAVTPDGLALTGSGPRLIDVFLKYSAQIFVK